MKLITLAEGVMKGCFLGFSSNRSLDLFFDFVDFRLSDRFDLWEVALRPFAIVVRLRSPLASRDLVFLDHVVFCDERV